MCLLVCVYIVGSSIGIFWWGFCSFVGLMRIGCMDRMGRNLLVWCLMSCCLFLLRWIGWSLFLLGRWWEFRGDCVAFVVSIGFSLALTSFFLRLGAVLNAMIGLSWKVCFRRGFCCTGFQCLFMIRYILCMSSQNCVLKISFLVVTLLFL